MSQHVVSVEFSSLLYYRLYLRFVCFCYDSLVSQKTTTPTEQIYIFTKMKAEGEGWDPVKLA